MKRRLMATLLAASLLLASGSAALAAGKLGDASGIDRARGPQPVPVLAGGSWGTVGGSDGF